eukprot:TRINITY_DN12481_c0_g1_i1.p1 TRINITY_DN12481_c0_g1~~TRINITY_DN12481_c0_g1_i1.p1  ORF type:complete len:529 (-),score=94.82 TRINITY_DN12481_c0_g1_i1:501-2087(-)
MVASGSTLVPFACTQAGCKVATVVAASSAYLGLWLAGFEDVLDFLSIALAHKPKEGEAKVTQVLKLKATWERLGHVSDLWSRSQKFVLVSVRQLDQEQTWPASRIKMGMRLCCCRRRSAQDSGSREGDAQASSRLVHLLMDPENPMAIATPAGSASETFGAPSEVSRKNLAEEPELDSMASSWIGAFDAGSTVSDLEVYVRHFCPTELGFGPSAAERLAEEGGRLWRAALASSREMRAAEEILGIVRADPGRAASSLIWALMRQALSRSKGFEQGTFVVHGPGVEEVFFALLPHAYDRSSSHFSRTVMWLTVEDIGRFSLGPHAADVEARALRGSSHVGLDVEADGNRDLPAGKQHVVLGRLRQHDGSVAVYMKPEDHGFDLSTGKMSEAALHAASYITSQVQRHFGDRRQHDEGFLKHKEYVPVEDKQLFDEALVALRRATVDAGADGEVSFSTSGDISPNDGPDLDRLVCYGLGEMARILRREASAAPTGSCRDEAFKLLERWESTYGPSLEFQRGREVLIDTRCF